MRILDATGLLKDTFTEWSEDKASRLGAAVAYYTVFSLAPLLIVVIAVAGLVFGQQAVRGEVIGQIQGMVGTDSANMIQTMLANASKPSTSIIATIIGIVTLLLGATGLFGELQDALNTIWEIAPKPRSLLVTIRERILSFGMVLGIGFLLLVSLVVSAGVSALGNFLGSVLPVPELILQILNFVISLGVVTLLFAGMFKMLPDAEVAWHDVWIGAAVTALLFGVGKLLIGLYLGHSGTASTYGAAASLVVLLLWVYYSAQILFFGAEFTQIYANRYGSKIKPAANAVALADKMEQKDLRPDTEHTPASETKPKAGTAEPKKIDGRQPSTTSTPRSKQNERVPERLGMAAPAAQSRLTMAAAVALGVSISVVRFLRERGRRGQGGFASSR